MAKQRGIHQISGKINNLCYYEQKYVRGGLIRRINEAMSERLKTDPVFENTRRANTIFGGWSIAAGAILEFFGSRNTFLFKPYRQALLTKFIQSHTINVNETATYPSIFGRELGFKYLPNIFDNIVKNKIRDSFPELPYKISEIPLGSQAEFVITYQSLIDFCTKYKCEGVQISFSGPKYFYGVSYSLNAGRYVAGDSNPGGRVSYQDFLKEDPAEDMSFRLSSGDIDDAVTFWIVYARPIKRWVNNRPIFSETGASCGLITYIAI